MANLPPDAPDLNTKYKRKQAAFTREKYLTFNEREKKKGLWGTCWAGSVPCTELSNEIHLQVDVEDVYVVLLD